MKTLELLVAGIITALSYSTLLASDSPGIYPLTDGFCWVYDNQGGSDWHQVTGKGTRTRTVEGKVQRTGREYIKVSDHYDQDGKAAVEYINAADCTLVAVDSADGSVTVDFTPCVRWPVPQLEAGKSLTETFEVAYDKTIAGSKNRKMKMRTTAKSVRLPDETVETPAGVFQQCVHVAVARSTSVDGVNAQIVVQSDLWLSPQVGMVKEVLHYSAICAPDGRVIKPERRSVSILRSFKSTSTACMATR